MSTTRRPLGIGPTTTTRSTATSSAPRLLPAERVEQLLADVDEDQDVAVRKGRRPLGPGAGHLPDAY